MSCKTFAFLFLPVLLLSSCGSSVRIYSDLEEGIDFTKYRTYNFLDFTDGNQRTISAGELESLRVAMARELEHHGLVFSPVHADVAVKVVVYHRRTPPRYYYAGGYMERAVAVDIYDNRLRKHVWHCAAVDDLEYNPQKREAEFSQVAASIFEHYPQARAN